MDESVFRAIRNKSLRAAGLGLEGVDVMLVGDALIIAGMNGPRRAFPLAGISRIRIGYTRNRYSGNLYRMKVWSADATHPLLLGTIHADERAFADIARRLAAALWTRGGRGAVEGGLGWVAALASVTWMTVTTIIAFFLLIHQSSRTAAKEPLWLILLILGPIMAFLIGLMLWAFFRPYHPRRLAGPDALGRFLPVADGP